MKSLKISKDIMPLGEFKTNAASILKSLEQRQSPLVITQNGRPACVIISPAEFDRLQERQAFLEAVADGLSDIKAGRILDHDTFTKRLENEFGVEK